MSLKTSVERITPDMARRWLANHGNFRTLRMKHVAFLAEEMKKGWGLNGEPIIFDSNGTLLDGQHRLKACFDSGISFSSLVVRGAEPHVETNTGLPRTLVDVLRNTGFANVCEMSTALRLLPLFETGKTYLAGNRRPIREYLTLLDRYSELESITSACLRVRGCESCGRLAALLAYGQGTVGTEAEYMIAGIAGTIELGIGDPVRVYRERLYKDRSSRAYKLTRIKRIAFMVLTWNALLLGREMKILKWANVGPASQPFPRPLRLIDGAIIDPEDSDIEDE